LLRGESVIDMLPGRLNDVPRIGNCFYKALVCAAKHADCLVALVCAWCPGMEDCLKLADGRLIRVLRVTMPALVERYADEADSFGGMHENLRNAYAGDVQTYAQLLSALPHAVAEAFEHWPPESAAALAHAYHECIEDVGSYASQLEVKAVERLLRDIGVPFQLVMAAEDPGAGSRDVAGYEYREGGITLVHFLDNEHYMWVGPRPAAAAAAAAPALKKRKRRT
jgi:hypothetical protein